MAKKVAILKFTEEGSLELMQVLHFLENSTFEYADQDGVHLVRLLSVIDHGLVTLIDLNKRTAKIKKGAVAYTVSLYDDGVLTYL